MTANQDNAPTGTEESPQDDIEPRNEKWDYGGVRVLSGKRVHAWLPDSGSADEVLFSMSGGHSIGEVYRAEVTRRDNGKTTLHGTPRYGGDGRVSEEIAARLRAENNVARIRLALLKQERATGKRDELIELLESLQVLARGLRTRADHTAFLAYVLRELSQPFSCQEVNGR